MPAPSGCDGRIVTSGGRVLCAVGLGRACRRRRSVQPMRWSTASAYAGMQFRHDIGYRAIARERASAAGGAAAAHGTAAGRAGLPDSHG